MCLALRSCKKGSDGFPLMKAIKCEYSGGLNSEHLNSQLIRNPNVSKFGFRMVPPFENQTIQNGRSSLGHFIKK